MGFSCPAHKPLLQLLQQRQRGQLRIHKGFAKMFSLSIANPEGRYILSISDTERLPNAEINQIPRPILNYLLLKQPRLMQSSSQLMGEAVSIRGILDVFSSVTARR